MPIPFIAAAAVSAAVGVGSSVKAANNTKEAKRIDNNARKITTEAEESLELRLVD